MHPVLFLDSKYSQGLPIMNLVEESRVKAAKEGRTACIGLFKRDDVQGGILCIHSQDFYTVCEEFLKARSLKIVPDCDPEDDPEE